MPTKDEEWEAFFQLAYQSGMFRGGSEIGEKRRTIGNSIHEKIPDSVAGYMKFETDELDDLLKILDSHPVIRNGGSIELLELPKP